MHHHHHPLLLSYIILPAHRPTYTGCPLNEKLGDDGIIELLESWEKGLSPTLETLDLSLCGLGTRALM